MNIQDVSGNDIMVDIVETPQEKNTQLPDVSGGDSHIESVSSNDAGNNITVTESVTYTVDNTEVVESLSMLNYTTTALLFFIIFSWVESKIHNGVRRLAEKWRK